MGRDLESTKTWKHLHTLVVVVGYDPFIERGTSLFLQ
jgi:hypothetical protein